MLKSKVSVLEKSSLTLSTNCKSINEKLIEMERNMDRLEKYCLSSNVNEVIRTVFNFFFMKRFCSH